MCILGLTGPAGELTSFGRHAAVLHTLTVASSSLYCHSGPDCTTIFVMRSVLSRSTCNDYSDAPAGGRRMPRCAEAFAFRPSGLAVAKGPHPEGLKARTADGWRE